MKNEFLRRMHDLIIEELQGRVLKDGEYPLVRRSGLLVGLELCRRFRGLDDFRHYIEVRRRWLAMQRARYDSSNIIPKRTRDRLNRYDAALRAVEIVHQHLTFAASTLPPLTIVKLNLTIPPMRDFGADVGPTTRHLIDRLVSERPQFLPGSRMRARSPLARTLQ